MLLGLAQTWCGKNIKRRFANNLSVSLRKPIRPAVHLFFIKIHQSPAIQENFEKLLTQIRNNLISTVNLYSDDIGDEEATALADALKVNTYITIQY